MRLLNVETLKLEDAICNSMTWPSYTILSHTWGEGEVSFQDLTSSNAGSLPGYQKLLRCCNRSKLEGFQRTWIDTCCIDKSSSAELSEAINSMFNWYSKAQVCYAYLSDVDGLGSDHPTKPSSSFRKSRWFQRGWTLQELLAPLEVVFFNRDWVEIGTKTSLASVITSITRIATTALDSPLCGSETVPHPCRGFSVAQKMSWAAFRETTREEDQAYSLLGLFGVNMPLLYGEGGEKAFSRLQQEIMKHSNDDSIFAWIRLEPRNWARILHYKGMHRRGFLAWRPQVFYAGHAIFTAATAKMFEDTRVTEWTSATLAHTSTSYEDKRDFISLNCPVLTLENLPEISKTRIFTACEESVAGSMLESEKVPSYKEFATESVENVLNGRVIAILSCCFVFGRVGIILEERQDGTYSRIHDPSIVGVQVTELPQPKLLKIRHREGAGDACGLRSMSSRCEITGLEVILLEKGGYSIAGRYFKCSEGITHGSWDTTEKGESISFLFPPREGRVALLYRHQGGDSVLNANFVLAFHWSFLTSFGFLGVTVSDNELIDKHWAKNLIWESKWQEPEPAQLSLGETKLVNISMRKAPGIGGRRWYIFLSFDNHNVI